MSALIICEAIFIPGGLYEENDYLSYVLLEILSPYV